ncbi:MULTISPECIES: ABC transporter ATP-binding protein [unclassified Curtobacterium]|uniref:ABC transporter ATP-binding protein n=1 Tax=unclassified Curtobacterium TaxID=257496 RepID=UPI003811A7FB
MSAPRSRLLALHCSKEYRGGARGLSEVDLDVAPGELVALLGPNGSGKSTLVHGLVGIHDLDSDAIEIDGIPHDSRVAKRHVGFVPDELPIPLSLTGTEFLAHVDRLRGGRDHLRWRATITERLGLTPHMRKFIGEMSHGTKKKLQIVSAVAHRPRLLVMDEPFRGLDPHAVVVIRALVDALRQDGTSVLVATHDVLAAEHWFERVVILDHGRIIADDRPQRLITDAGVAALEDVMIAMTGLDDTATVRADLALALAPGPGTALGPDARRTPR